MNFMKKLTKKQRWALFGSLGILILSGGLIFFLTAKTGSAQSQGEQQLSEMVRVTRGTIQESIEANGNLDPIQERSLGFSSSGRVVELYVAEGEQVKAEAPLVRIDTTNLEIALAEAENSLEQAQIQLDEVKAGPTEAELAAAKASVNSAQASYTQTKAGTSPEQLAQLEANLRLAEKKVQQAQGNYNRYGSRMAGSLQDATLAYEAARVAYEIAAAGPTSYTLASSWSQVAQAQASLQELQKGATSEEVQTAELKVRQAELALEKARRNLENGTLTAPFAGTVTALNVGQGEIAGSSAVVTLADLSAAEITISLDESDVILIHEGGTALITVEALDGVVLTGTVTAIAPAATVQSGVAFYPVTVQVKGLPPTVRAGMTVDVAIITEAAENILYLPQRAVQTEGGKSYVMRQTGTGTFEKIEITLGKALGGNVEITAGLNEGDVIGVYTEVTENSTPSTMMMGGGPEMGEVRPAMGGDMPPVGRP